MAATLRPSDSDGLNLRSGPGTSYGVVGTLAAGQSLKVLGSQNGWFKVKTASGQEAWAIGTYSRVSYEDEQAYAVVATDALNFRTDPSLTGKVLTVLKQDERVRLLEIFGDWWKVARSNGDSGWVNGTFMIRDTSAPSAPTPTTPTPTTPATPAPTTPTPTTPTPTTPTPPPVTETAPPPAPPGTVPVLPVLPLPPAAPLGNKAVWAAANGTLYSGRNAGAFDAVDRVKPGEKLTYLGAAEGWVKVRTPRGLTGWLVGSAITMTEGKLSYALQEGSWSLAYTSVATAVAPAAAVPAAAPAQAAPAAAAASSNGERRVVRDPDGLNLRQAGNELAKIITALPQGEVLTITKYDMPWVQVVTASGLTGWVNALYTDPYTGPAAPAPAPAPAPTPAPAPAPVVIGGGLSAKLIVVSTGVLQLDVTSTDKALGEPTAAGNTITIPVSTGETGAYNLPVAAAGAQTLSLTAAGLTLSMDSLPTMQVVERTSAHLVLRLCSTLTGLAVQTAADRTIYNFSVAGPVTPTTRISGSDVIVEFPGAASGVTGALPAGVRVIPGDKSTQVAISSNRPYALKRTAGGFELDLYQPGLAGKTIVLDPGHGGWDPGAANAKTGLKEKDVNLAIALRLRAALAAKGATVLMSRATDTRSAPDAIVAQMPDDPTHADLGYRSRIANDLKADAFISIHQNCCSSNGTEDYYTSYTLNGERSAALADLMVNTVAPGLGQRNRGKHDDLMYVTRTNDAPAILLEVEFIDDPVEGAKAGKSAYQEQVAALMVQALDKFYAERK
jgi:N-acetylmuramoyl-L-alanine amidase